MLLCPIELRLDTLARLLGRLSGGRLYDSRLWWVDDATEASSSRTDELTLPPLTRRRERIVTVVGINVDVDDENVEGVRGVPLTLSAGAGSRDRADWTLSSSFCILPMRPRIWYNDPDRGMFADGSREPFGREVVDPLAPRGMDGVRVCRA